MRSQAKLKQDSNPSLPLDHEPSAISESWTLDESAIQALRKKHPREARVKKPCSINSFDDIDIRKDQPRQQAKSPRKRRLIDLSTRQRAPKGISNLGQYLDFDSYVRRFVSQTKENSSTYVDNQGNKVAGTTKKTLFSFLMKQKRKEFRSILKAGGRLPPLPKRRCKSKSAISASPSPAPITATAHTPTSSSRISDQAPSSALDPSGNALSQKRKLNPFGFFEKKESNRVESASTPDSRSKATFVEPSSSTSSTSSGSRSLNADLLDCAMSLCHLHKKSRSPTPATDPKAPSSSNLHRLFPSKAGAAIIDLADDRVDLNALHKKHKS